MRVRVSSAGASSCPNGTKKMFFVFIKNPRFFALPDNASLLDIAISTGRSFRKCALTARKMADMTFCEQPCACCEATVSRGVFNHTCGCSFCNIKSAALCRRLLYINLSHQKRLNLFAFQRRLDSGWNHLDLCDERSRFFYRIVLSERYEIDVPRVH